MKLEDALRKRLSELIIEKAKNPTDLSLESNLTPSTLFDFLHKRTKHITLPTLAKLCEGLDMSLEEFFAKDYLKHFDDTF